MIQRLNQSELESILIGHLIVLIAKFQERISFQDNFVPCSPNVYKVDLNLPPIERWRQIITEKNESIWGFRNLFIENMTHLEVELINLFPKYISELYDKKFTDEVAAIAELSGLTFEFTLLLNFMYEIFAYCTSIVAQNQQGLLIHGRNFDYGFQSSIANLTATVNFYKDGSYIYTANIAAGYLGISTGMKPGTFGITVNQRDLNDSIYNNILEAIGYRALPGTYLVRLVLEEENDYESAIQRLSNTRIIAPMYYIVSGTKSNQGMVITRNRNNVTNYYGLNIAEGIWFVVQTNYDRDVSDPPDDYRRIPAKNKLNAIGQQNISYE